MVWSGGYGKFLISSFNICLLFYLKVGYNTSDVGTAIMSYKVDRMQFVDYSLAIGLDGAVWWSKLPTKVASMTNLIRTFDSVSCGLIGISLVLISSLLTIVAYLGTRYGVGTKDYVSVLLVPFRMLNAESMPRWFDQNNQHPSRQKTFMPGFTGHYLLLLWSMTGWFLAMAYLSNIRAMLLSPNYAKPVDYTKDLFSLGKVPVNAYKYGMWPRVLKNSPNKWEQKAYEVGFSMDYPSDRDLLLQTAVYEDGTHSLLTTYELVDYGILQNHWYNDKNPPYFHISKEVVRPYYHGWVYNKVSKWKDDLDMHILFIQQVMKYY